MKKRSIRVFQAVLLAVSMIGCFSFSNKGEAAKNQYVYLDSIKPSKMAQYDGNEGDSFVYAIGKYKYTRGNKDIEGNTYKHGIEAWVARWNYTPELSWAYSIYNINGKYESMSSKVVLIDSYNTTKFDTTLYFYGDGKLIKKYHMVPASFPFKVNIDLTGVKKLKIYVKDNAAVAGGTSFGLTGCKLKAANKIPKIKLSSSNIKLDLVKNKEKQLTAKKVNISGTVKWKSSNTKVAKVDKNGTVKAVGEGKAAITAYIKNVKAACKVVVTDTAK